MTQKDPGVNGSWTTGRLAGLQGQVRKEKQREPVGTRHHFEQFPHVGCPSVLQTSLKAMPQAPLSLEVLGPWS